MLIKEYSLRKERKQRQRQGLAERDIQSDSFYFVLVFSIISVVIDIISSVAMNDVTNWWVYQITMTIYVISMPLLAAVWVGYACTLIYRGQPLKKILQKISILSIPLEKDNSPFKCCTSHDIFYNNGMLYLDSAC